METDEKKTRCICVTHRYSVSKVLVYGMVVVVGWLVLFLFGINMHGIGFFVLCSAFN